MTHIIWKRIAYITDILKKNKFSIKFKKLKIIDDSLSWFKLEAFRDHFRIAIMEVWKGDNRIRYSYALLDENNQNILRYDNAPHHPRIKTFPDHKHIYNKVLELEDSSFESFLNEAISILERINKTL